MIYLFDMKLTGKAKIDFEKWFEVNPDNSIGLTEKQRILVRNSQLKIFYYLTNSMQYGVFVDFFGSVGIYLETRKIIKYAYVIKYPNNKGIRDRYDRVIDTRNEARQEAIIKANEIYNELF